MCNFDVDRQCMVKYAGANIQYASMQPLHRNFTAKYVGEEPADLVGKRFAEETGLKFEFAMVWLEQNGVDFEKALVEFNEAKAEGNILPEAYSES